MVRTSLICTFSYMPDFLKTLRSLLRCKELFTYFKTFLFLDETILKAGRILEKKGEFCEMGDI